MKRKWIAALACLAMLAALGGCSGTGDVNDPNASSSAANSPDNNYGGNLPNNANGSANNPGGINSPSGGLNDVGGNESGTGMIGGSGTDGLDLDHDGKDDDVFHTDPGGNGNYNADDDGTVNGGEDNDNVNGRMRSAGNDLRDMADSAGRAIRDIL